MKISINEIINCVNSALISERKAKSLPEILGHFVFHLNWEKKMGAVKSFHTYIDFINTTKGTSHLVVGDTYTMTCPIEKIEEAKEFVTIKTLERFFITLRLGKGNGAYENFVNGTFEGWT